MWLPRSELSTESRRENQEGSLFGFSAGAAECHPTPHFAGRSDGSPCRADPVWIRRCRSSRRRAARRRRRCRSRRVFCISSKPRRPPSLARERAGRADVILTIDVDEQGRVTDVAVAQSAGPELDRAAVAAARQFTFEPGEAGGKPVPVRINYTYHFAPKPPPAPPRTARRRRRGPRRPRPPRRSTGVVLRKGDRAPIAGVTVTAGEAAPAVTGETAASRSPRCRPARSRCSCAARPSGPSTRRSR